MDKSRSECKFRSEVFGQKHKVNQTGRPTQAENKKNADYEDKSRAFQVLVSSRASAAGGSCRGKIGTGHHFKKGTMGCGMGRDSRVISLISLPFWLFGSLCFKSGVMSGVVSFRLVLCDWR